MALSHHQWYCFAKLRVCWLNYIWSFYTKIHFFETEKLLLDDFSQNISERPSIKRLLEESSDETLVVPNVNRLYKRVTTSNQSFTNSTASKDDMDEDIKVDIPGDNDISGRIWFNFTGVLA